MGAWRWRLGPSIHNEFLCHERLSSRWLLSWVRPGYKRAAGSRSSQNCTPPPPPLLLIHSWLLLIGANYSIREVFSSRRLQQRWSIFGLNLFYFQSVPSNFHLGGKRAFIILDAGGVSRCQSSINLANTKFLGRSSFATPFFSSFLLRIRFLPNLPFQKAESQGRKDKRSNFHFFWQNSMPTMEMGAN